MKQSYKQWARSPLGKSIGKQCTTVEMFVSESLCCSNKLTVYYSDNSNGKEVKESTVRGYYLSTLRNMAESRFLKKVVFKVSGSGGIQMYNDECDTE